MPHKHHAPKPEPGLAPTEEQATKDRADQQAKRDAAEKAGNIPQVSSAPLHNYPDAQMPKAQEGDDTTPDVEQPRSGTSATAKEQPGVESEEDAE
jgi:hypothetical protein